MTEPPAPEIPLPPDAERQLQELGADPADPHIRLAVLIGTGYAGPIPPPDMLLKYRSIHPDLPDRIIRWTEDQRAHRFALERLATSGSEARMNRGQIFAFVLAALGLCLSAVVGIAGSAIVGSTLAVVSIGGPAVAFVLARTLDWRSAGGHGPRPSQPDSDR